MTVAAAPLPVIPVAPEDVLHFLILGTSRNRVTCTVHGVFPVTGDGYHHPNRRVYVKELSPLLTRIQDLTLSVNPRGGRVEIDWTHRRVVLCSTRQEIARLMPVHA